MEAMSATVDLSIDQVVALAQQTLDTNVEALMCRLCASSPTAESVNWMSLGSEFVDSTDTIVAAIIKLVPKGILVGPLKT